MIRFAAALIAISLTAAPCLAQTYGDAYERGYDSAAASDDESGMRAPSGLDAPSSEITPAERDYSDGYRDGGNQVRTQHDDDWSSDWGHSDR